MIHEAAFDVLAIMARLQALGAVFPSEVHLFGYLACLVSLYDKQPVAEWEYGFAGTLEGAPYSVDIASAIEGQIHSGDITCTPDGALILTTRGSDEYQTLRSLHTYEARERYIRAACDSVLAMPIGVVRMGLAFEPAMQRAANANAPRILLTKIDLDYLYEQFGHLSSALEPTSELMVPAIVWISHLAQATGLGSSLEEV